MRFTVEFGDETAEIEVADERLIALAAPAPQRPVADVAAAVAAALGDPIEFPPLWRAIVPGDHVAIVLDLDIPRPGDIVGPIVECLIAADVQPHDIQLIEVPRPSPCSNGLAHDRVPPGVEFVRHDPADQTRLSYLASTKAGNRVYLNRAVVDADLVVLTGQIDYDPILGYRGTGSGVFPGLADDAATRRLRAQISAATCRTQAAARGETDEVAWLLGVQFAVQLVLGERSEVVAVLAGELSAVQRAGQQCLDRIRRRTAARRADLVVAGVSGRSSRQRFTELGTVLDATRSLVRENGQVIVFSTIDDSPGPTLKSVLELDEPEKIDAYLRRHPESDSVSTSQITRATRHARVYLKSRLPDGLVEELGITPIGSTGEAQRLVTQAGSCIILNDAQLARLHVEGQDEESIA